MQSLPLMLFAAGFGTRMGDLTRSRPKPLLMVNDKALIDHALAIADQVCLGPKVVNLHYLGEQIERHLAGTDVVVVWERGRILDTGGGLRAALPILGPGPVLTLNTDAVWTGQNPLSQLTARWDPATMDVLQLLLPARNARGHLGKADFLMGETGQIRRAIGDEGFVYLGAQIVKTEWLLTVPEDVFSLNLLWDHMIAKGTAFGLVHNGGWCDVGRPEGLAEAEAMLAQVSGV